MIGYLFVLLALFVGATKGYCGKRTSGVITTYPDTMLFNAVRMLICIPIGLLFVLLYTGSAGSLVVDAKTLLISAMAGIATSAFVVSWIVSVRRGAYMMVEVFLTLGVIVPVILCRVFFGEEVRISQLAGIALLVAATYIMCSYNNSIKADKLSWKLLLPMSISGVANGLTSFSQKWFRYESAADVTVFNFYTYVFSAAALLVCWLFVRMKDSQGGKATDRKLPLARLGVYVTIMSLCIFLHSLFSTMATEHLTSSQLYPLMQGGGLTLSMLMSAVFFKEKITPRCLMGIGIAFGALLCINLL